MPEGELLEQEVLSEDRNHTFVYLILLELGSTEVTERSLPLIKPKQPLNQAVVDGLLVGTVPAAILRGE